MTTTINSFWNSWSATQPNTLKEAQNEHNHSASLIVSESTAQKPNNIDGLLPWMKDILNDHNTTERSVQTTTELMPSWLQNVISQHTMSSTAKSTIIRSTTTKHPDWLKGVIDRETSSTTTEIPNWLSIGNILNHHAITETTNPTNEFSNDNETTTWPWNNGILNSYSTTTVRTWLPFGSTTSKSSSGDGFLSNPNNGGGGDGIEFIDLTNANRYSK